MHESSTYQAILDEGAVAQLRETLLKLGKARFGAATPEQANKVKAIEDLARLDRLTVRLLKVNSWDELLRGR